VLRAVAVGLQVRPPCYGITIAIQSPALKSVWLTIRVRAAEALMDHIHRQSPQVGGRNLEHRRGHSTKSNGHPSGT